MLRSSRFEVCPKFAIHDSLLHLASRDCEQDDGVEQEEEQDERLGEGTDHLSTPSPRRNNRAVKPQPFAMTAAPERTAPTRHRR